MEEDFNPRIKKTAAALMIAVALFYDGLQALFNLIPIAGQILAYLVLMLSAFHFFIWFKIHDVGFLERFGAKKILAYIAVPIIEILTVGVAPGIAIATGITISIVKFEDELIKAGLITREDLRKIEKFVIRAGKVHGFDSPEFKQALSGSLKKEVEKRYSSPEARGVITTTVNQQVKSGATEKKPAGNSSQGEIDILKKDIQRYKAELQQLGPQIVDTSRRLKEAQNTMNEMMALATQGLGAGGTPQEVYQIHQSGMLPLQNKYQSLNQKSGRLKDLVFSMSNKLSRLERENPAKGTARKAA